MDENPFKSPADNASQARGHENRIASLLFSFSVRSLIASIFLGLAAICGFYAALAALFAALGPQAKSFWPDVYISAISLANATTFSITAWAIWSRRLRAAIMAILADAAALSLWVLWAKAISH